MSRMHFMFFALILLISNSTSLDNFESSKPPRVGLFPHGPSPETGPFSPRPCPCPPGPGPKPPEPGPSPPEPGPEPPGPSPCPPPPNPPGPSPPGPSPCPPAAKPLGPKKCKRVGASIRRCMTFLTKRKNKPTKKCCSGTKQLEQSIKENKVQACECIKLAIKRRRKYDPIQLPEIPKQCGQNYTLPPIDKKYDCKNWCALIERVMLPIFH